MNASDRKCPSRQLRLCTLLLLLVALPGIALAQVRDGKNLLQAGRLDEAMKAYERAANEGLAEGRAGVGLVWLRKRQLDKALESFQAAQKMDPNLALAYYGEGEVARRRNKCDEAVPLYRKATELDRKFPEAQLALGQCLVGLRKHEEAVTALNEGLKWGPRWRPRFLVALGDAELARDSLRDAGIYYTKAREEAPEDPTPRRALGDFYVKRGIPALAVPEYQAAVSMDSTDVELIYALAHALDLDNRAFAALEQYRLAVTKDPDFAPAQYSLGYLLYRAGQNDAARYQEARAPLEKYTQLEPTDPRGFSVLARDLYYLRLRDDAYVAFKKAEDLGEKGKDFWTVYARLLAERREYEASLAAYGKADPDANDMLVIAQLYSLHSQPAQAESVYAAVVTRDSTTRGARMALGEMGKIRFRGKDFEGAVGTLGRLIALDPQNGEAYYYTGLSYKEMGRFPDALSALRQSVALDPSKADRQFWLGIVCAQQDSIPQARAAFEQTVALDSTGKGQYTSIALRQLGYYKLLDKDFAGAVQLLERAVAINPKDTQALIWVAQGYQNLGNRAKALEYYRRLLELDPNNADAKKGINALSGKAAQSGAGGAP